MTGSISQVKISEGMFDNQVCINWFGFYSRHGSDIHNFHNSVWYFAKQPSQHSATSQSLHQQRVLTRDLFLFPSEQRWQSNFFPSGCLERKCLSVSLPGGLALFLPFLERGSCVYPPDLRPHWWWTCGGSSSSLSLVGWLCRGCRRYLNIDR